MLSVQIAHTARFAKMVISYLRVSVLNNVIKDIIKQFKFNFLLVQNPSFILLVCNAIWDALYVFKTNVLFVILVCI